MRYYTNFVQQKCLKCVIMNQKNVAFTPLANLDNPKIAERYAIENLVVTKNCVNTHTHTHTFSPPIPRALIYSIPMNLQSGVKIILHALLCLYLASGRYLF